MTIRESDVALVDMCVKIRDIASYESADSAAPSLNLNYPTRHRCFYNGRIGLGDGCNYQDSFMVLQARLLEPKQAVGAAQWITSPRKSITAQLFK